MKPPTVSVRPFYVRVSVPSRHHLYNELLQLPGDERWGALRRAEEWVAEAWRWHPPCDHAAWSELRVWLGGVADGMRMGPP